MRRGPWTGKPAAQIPAQLCPRLALGFWESCCPLLGSASWLCIRSSPAVPACLPACEWPGRLPEPATPFLQDLAATRAGTSTWFFSGERSRGEGQHWRVLTPSQPQGEPAGHSRTSHPGECGDGGAPTGPPEAARIQGFFYMGRTESETSSSSSWLCGPGRVAQPL